MSLFNLRHLRDLTSHTSRRGILYIYINVFFLPFGIFSSSDRGSFLVFSPPSHAWSPPEPHTNVWALAEVRGTCSGGSKWQLRSGRDYQHVESSRPMQTHVQVKRMSDISCDIWDLEYHQTPKDNTYLVMENFFPDTNMPDMRPLLIQ